MRGDRARQALQVIAAFHQRNQAAAAALGGELHQRARRPGEIRFRQLQVAEGIAVMRIEAGGYDEEIGRESLDPRQDRRLQRLAENVAAVAGRRAAR